MLNSLNPIQARIFLPFKGPKNFSCPTFQVPIWLWYLHTIAGLTGCHEPRKLKYPSCTLPEDEPLNWIFLLVRQNAYWFQVFPYLSWYVIAVNSRWFQVMGIPRKRGQCLAVIYSNIVALNTRLFTREGIPVKRLTPKSYLKSFLDASGSHKTSANLSVRDYFRQFPDW